MDPYSSRVNCFFSREVWLHMLLQGRVSSLVHGNYFMILIIKFHISHDFSFFSKISLLFIILSWNMVPVQEERTHTIWYKTKNKNSMSRYITRKQIMIKYNFNFFCRWQELINKSFDSKFLPCNDWQYWSFLKQWARNICYLKLPEVSEILSQLNGITM